MKKRSLRRFLIITYALIASIVSITVSAVAIYYIKSSTNVAYTNYENAMNQGYNTEIKSQVQSSLAVIEHYYNKYQAGELTEEQAKYEAKEAVRAMRYRDDNSGYMWIDASDYTLVMHPILPQNEGKNRYTLEDQNGVMIIQEIMKAADNGGGYNQFYFTKADGVAVALKVAYSESFKPWGWVVTTGNYVDDMDLEMADVKGEITSMFGSMVIVVIIVAVFLIILSIIVSLIESNFIIMKPLKQIESMAERMSRGDITQETDVRIMNDIGRTAAALNVAQSNIKELVINISEVSDAISMALSDFGSSFKQMSVSIHDVSVAVDDISQNVTTQADFTRTATEDVESIGNSIVTTEGEVQQLDENAQDMQNLSEKSMETLNQLVSISNITKEQIHNMHEQTTKTNESVNKIKDAANLINDIAEQTDLLALNASIEAAKAGEAGRGFSVVAEQIGNLAKQSAENVIEIDNVVEELLSNANRSLEIMDGMTEDIRKQFEYIYTTQKDFSVLNESLKKCIRSVGAIDTMTSNIEIQRQNINGVLSKLNGIAQDNAASSEETSAMSAELSEMVNSSSETILKLDKSVKDLLENVGKFKF